MNETIKTPPPDIDEAAVEVLRAAQAALLTPKSYRAECWKETTSCPPSEASDRPPTCEWSRLTAVRPNLMHYDSWLMNPTGERVSPWATTEAVPTFTFVCDGKTNWKQFGAMYRTDQLTAPDQLHTMTEPWEGFYSAASSPFASLEHYRAANQVYAVRRDGAEAVEGEICEKIFVHYQTEYNGKSMEFQTTWYVGPDGLVRRKVEQIVFGGTQGIKRDSLLRHIETDFDIAHPTEFFRYTPPEGVHRETPEERSQQAKTLPVGTPVPEFVATTLDGGTIQLSDFRGSVVVVDFWSGWCGPCVQSMPHNQEVTRRLQDEGLPVVFLAIDNGEPVENFAKWVRAHPEFDALRFAHIDPAVRKVSAMDFRVSGIPAQFVIDAKGIVSATFVGFGGPTDDLEKAIRAALREKGEE